MRGSADIRKLLACNVRCVGGFLKTHQDERDAEQRDDHATSVTGSFRTAGTRKAENEIGLSLERCAEIAEGKHQAEPPSRA
jgi:hypothetical protein